MNDIKRNLTMALGVVGVAAWARPVVSAVALPAHASTTGRIFFGGALDFVTKLDANENEPFARVRDLLVPKAQAGRESNQCLRIRNCRWC